MRLSTLGLLVTVLAYVLPAPPVSGDIVYAASWVWGDAVAHADGGWSVTNDLGYTVTVERGYVVDFSTQLIACEHSHAWGGIAWLEKLVGVAVVQAGHSSGDVDPAALTTATAEPIHSPALRELGTVTVNEPDYCEGHYLVARADGDTLNLPDDLDLHGMSLTIEGTYQRADMDAPVTFTAQTALANGAITTLSRVDLAGFRDVHVEISDEPVYVTIQRRLDTLFDGVDFAAMSRDEIGQAVLWSLIDGTRLLVTGGNLH